MASCLCKELKPFADIHQEYRGTGIEPDLPHHLEPLIESLVGRLDDALLGRTTMTEAFTCHLCGALFEPCVPYLLVWEGNSFMLSLPEVRHIVRLLTKELYAQGAYCVECATFYEMQPGRQEKGHQGCPNCRTEYCGACWLDWPGGSPSCADQQCGVIDGFGIPEEVLARPVWELMSEEVRLEWSSLSLILAVFPLGELVNLPRSEIILPVIEKRCRVQYFAYDGTPNYPDDAEDDPVRPNYTFRHNIDFLDAFKRLLPAMVTRWNSTLVAPTDGAIYKNDEKGELISC